MKSESLRYQPLGFLREKRQDRKRCKMHQSIAVGFTINLATCAVGSFSHCELDLRLPCTGTDWFAIQALIGACIQVIGVFQ